MTERELQDWIHEEVRRRPVGQGFASPLNFVRFHTPSNLGATWGVDSTDARATWTPALRNTFDLAIRQAQRAFDLID